MMEGTIQNRQSFLKKVASQLGRESVIEEVSKPVWKHHPQHEVLKDASKEELIDVLKEHCTKIHTDWYETDMAELPFVLKKAIQAFGGESVITTNDSRFYEYGLSPLFADELPEEQVAVYEWNPAIGEENIMLAERANIGITFSEITLAESATVVLYSSPEKGRSVSLLPQTYIAIIPKSSIVPRMTQAAQIIRNQIKKGEIPPSCINYITGPSNSADIEMNLVVGVHGPVKAAYILVEDK